MRIQNSSLTYFDFDIKGAVLFLVTSARLSKVFTLNTTFIYATGSYGPSLDRFALFQHRVETSLHYPIVKT